jgi:hypothetical protein
VVNTFMQIVPGARISNGAVYSPHVLSHDSPSPRSYAVFNRTLLDESSFWLKLFVAWLVMFAVCFVSCTSALPLLNPLLISCSCRHPLARRGVVNG